MVGIDIIEFDEFNNKKIDLFLNKYFTLREKNYISSKKNSLETLAGIFCAKESFLKSIGQGLGFINLKDIEILHKESGTPYIFKNEIISSILGKLGFTDLHISISHSKNSATAICILQK